MGLRRSAHAVYELEYHVVWVPKYRAKILGGEVSEYLKKVFEEIAEHYDFHITAMEVMPDHIHMLVEAPPTYSPTKIVQTMKSISARELYARFPKMKKEMWSGKIWGEGYFVRSVGDKLTSEVISKYIQYQKSEEGPKQMKMSFEW